MELNIVDSNKALSVSDEIFGRTYSEDLIHQVVNAYRAAGGTVQEDKHYPVFHIGRTPPTLMEIARSMRRPISDRYDTPFVFNKELVSVASPIKVPEDTKLLGPGHPLFEILIEWAIRNASEAFARGAILIDPGLARPQRIWLVRSSIEDGRVETRHRLAHEKLALVVADALGMRETSPSYLLSCTPPDGKMTVPDLAEQSHEDIQS